MTNPTRSSSDAGTGMVGVLAGVLRLHHPTSMRFSECWCGWTGDRFSELPFIDEYNDHLAAALAAAVGERGDQ